jgi:hypothetical protein
VLEPHGGLLVSIAAYVARGCIRGAAGVLWTAKGCERGSVMESRMMFLDCPAYLDEHGAARCGLPAEVEYRYGAQSTDGVLESAKIRCPVGHWFSGTVESLTWDKGPRVASSRTKSAGLPRNA